MCVCVCVCVGGGVGDSGVHKVKTDMICVSDKIAQALTKHL